MRTNILQVDVKPWYLNLTHDDQDKQEDRVLHNTMKIINLLDEYDEKAIFYILSQVE